jgi:anthranilate phosphoribosyltransferase
MPLTRIDHIEAGHILTRVEAAALMDEVLSGTVETAEIVRLLTALNTRPYEVEEIVGFALGMRRRATRVFGDHAKRPSGLVDTCGTGGGYAGTFNISTAAAIVAAAVGARVAKHGNRSSRSLCGSADVLEALGVRIDVPLAQVGRAIQDIGIGFLYAPAAHEAMRHAVAARRQISVRTIFNLLGPLTNPAGAQAQVVGVFSADVIDLIAAALAELGAERAFIVHGADGLGEISLSTETFVAEVKSGTVRRYTVTPEEFGMSRAPLEAIRGGSATENAVIIRGVLAGEIGPRRDIVVINAAAALVAAGQAGGFIAAAKLAAAALDSGAAEKKLSQMCSFG